MVNKKLYIAIAMLVLAGLTLSLSKNKTKSDQMNMVFKPKAHPIGDTYDKLWAEVLEFEHKGLYESALKKVKEIYDKAYLASNTNQIVKCTIYKIKYNQYMKEDDYVLAIDNLNSLVAESASPQKEILHSLTAQVYWGYYQNNRWKFNQRTNTVNFEQKDIRTWSLEKIVEHVSYHYEQSLKNSEQTKILDIESFKEILTDGHVNEGLRPTLYDFLAHRALDFYKNTEPDITKPAYAFKLDQKEIFSSANDFIQFKLVDRDTESNKRKAFELLQDLVKFHLKVTKNEEALVNVELERLSFARVYSVLLEKDSLYFKALNKLSSSHRNTPSFAEINYHLASFHIERSTNYVFDLKGDEKNDIYKWDKKTALGLCLEGINKYPKSYGAKLCETLRNSIQHKSISFNTDEVSIPNQPSKGTLSFTNIDKAFVKVIKVDYVKNKDKEFKDNKERIDYYNSLDIINKWDLDLKHEEDYLGRNTEFSIPSLPEGYYLIMVADNEQFNYDTNAVGFSFFWKSNISYISRQNDNQEYEFTVLHRKNSDPIDGVKAKVYFEKYSYVTRKYVRKHVGNFTTDANGYFKIPSPSEYRSIYVEFKNGDDELILGNSYYQSRNYNYNEKNYPKGYIFIDRGIYRPGQTLYFKGIVIEEINNKAKVLANKKVIVDFYDANYQKIESKNLTTNEYGTVSGEFTTPQNGMNGSMRIQMRMESGNNLQTKYFRVEEYKRPKFEVDFNPIKGSYKLNQTIKVQGIAKAFAGNNIDGAKVKYRVTRTASFPWWCWYYWRYTPSSPSMEITSGETITDDNGNFDVEFKAIPDPSVSQKYSPTYSYQVTADVTDINGETRSNIAYVSVGYKALTVRIDIQSQIDKNGENKFDIISTNLNGEKIPSEGTINLYRFNEKDKLFRSRKWSRPSYFVMEKSKHDNLFPHDIYDNENELTDTDKEKVKEYTYKFTGDEKENPKLELRQLSNLKPGQYQLEVLTKDEFGTDIKEIQNFMIFDKKGNQPPVNNYSWFKQLNYSVEPGEKAQFLVSSSAKDVKVLYEIEHQGKIINKEWITLSNEQKLVEIPVIEKYRGNIGVHFVFIKDNRVYSQNFTVLVPFTNKKLDVTFETFRDKLYPGQKEKWKINIKGPNGDKVAAEMLATMYDASLDEFSNNSFYMNVYNSFYSRLNWETYRGGYSNTYSSVVSYNWNKNNPYYQHRVFPSLKLFGAYFGNNYYGDYGGGETYFAAYSEYDMADEEATETVMAEGNGSAPGRTRNKQARSVASSPSFDKDDAKLANNVSGLAGGKEQEQQNIPEPSINQPKKIDLGIVKARTNFNETAFFYPELRTNSKGEISIEFEIPEALTKWKFLSISHTKDMKVGYLSDEIVTQKDLMVVPNAPRFFREGDKITLSSKISNISKKDVTGESQLFLYDALTMTPIDVQLMNTNAKRNFTAKAGTSTSVSWDIEIPFGYQSVVYKVVAASEDFSDGEQKALPVLTNRMLVTEPMPLPIRKKGTKVFEFDKLLKSGGSTTLKHHQLTLEYTSNPAWYVVQAMPYMMEYPYECAEQTFTRFYANSLATHIMNSNPKIKQIVEAWKDLSPDEFLSNLEKNQELKAVILEETPWVLEAKDESARKKRIAQLFDLNKMTNELDRAMKKLQKMQVSNGGWPWFKGGRESRYITQHIVTGMGHLDNLSVKNVREDNKTWNMVKSAIKYLDMRIVEDFEDIKKYDKEWQKNKHLNNIQIQYLYARTFFNDVTMSNSTTEAYDYFLSQSKKYWLDFNIYTQGMIALANFRHPAAKTGIHVEQEIMASLKERAIKNEELGMYWKGMMDGGYYWYQAPIETQALLIEAFQTVTQDTETVEDLKAWLLKQKQTTDWKTTKATAEACYALLLNGTDLLANNDLVEVKVGNYVIDYSGKPTQDKFKKQVKADPGTGYFKTAWSGAEVTPDMGKVTVSKKEDGVAWGALYWQYFENLDKITPHDTPLKLEKKLFKQRLTDKGEVLDPITEDNVLEVGDKVIVRIELRVDRNMEYVHMKDMRASGFEPLNVLSTYKWQDGLGYYESTKDASTNFFFDVLPRGTYVFEYPLRVFQKGDFSNGITSIQCMYAPEFASHSEGIRVKVK